MELLAAYVGVCLVAYIFLPHLDKLKEEIKEKDELIENITKNLKNDPK